MMKILVRLKIIFISITNFSRYIVYIYYYIYYYI